MTDDSDARAFSRRPLSPLEDRPASTLHPLEATLDGSQPATAARQLRGESKRLAGLQVVFASLRHRDYRFLWIATLCLSAGQWIQQVTLGWLIYDLTGSAVLLGVMHGFRAFPFLFAAPIAGVAADRMDRRKLLIATQPLLVGACMAMGTLVVLGRVETWHIFAFTLSTAIVWAFNNPIRQALVPNLVPKQDLMNAIALNSVGFNTNKVLGPALGGLLIVWFGAGGNFFLEAVAYTSVLVLFLYMRVPPTPPQARESSAMANFKEGWAYVWNNPVLLALLLASMVPPIFAVPVAQTLLPVYQKDVFGVGPEGLGLLMAGPGVGAVIATLILATVGHRIKRHGLIMLSDMVLMGLATILFAQAPSLPLAAVALVAVGMFQMFFFTISHTLLQVMVPDALRGRVNSIYMLDWGVGPVGSLLAGVLTQLIGAPTTTAIFGAIVTIMAVVIAWRAPRLLRAQT